MDTLYIFFVVSWNLLLFSSPSYGDTAVNSSLHLVMAPKGVTTEDYYCTAVALPKGDKYIVGFEPNMHSEIAHHMLLFGCDSNIDPSLIGKTWDCKRGPPSCGYSLGTTLYAWAKEAPGLRFPKGVGIKVGPSAKIIAVTMQVHFHSAPRSKADYPRLTLSLTTRHQPNVAGVYLLGGMADGLQPGLKDTTVNVACKFSGPNSIHPLGFRTHAHSLSPLIVGFVKSRTNKKWKLIGQHSPQEPQAFYPVQDDITINPGDIMAARCHYDTRKKSSTVYFGSDSNNEMCNFYIMFYMKNNGRILRSMECWRSPPKNFKFPKLSQFVSPTQLTTTTNLATHNISHGHHSIVHVHIHPSPSPSPLPPSHPVITLAEDWPLNNVNDPSVVKELLGMKLGQVTGVSVDKTGHVYMFHRGDHVWDENSFSFNGDYLQRDKGPIKSPTLLVTDPTGNITTVWGPNLFYLPHGLTIDSSGVIWLTDVARQQIFKLSSLSKKTPLALGVAFKPGSNVHHFCKPAAIAVDTQRDRFYIADGYCNHRIIVFTTKGAYLAEFSQEIQGVSLQVPHSLALNNDSSVLYVADRENYRIIKYNTSSGKGSVFVTSAQLGGPVYAISFHNSRGQWPLYAVIGATGNSRKAEGFTINQHGHVIDKWSPFNEGFGQPHDIAVNSDGSALYVCEIGPNKVWKFDVQIHDTLHNFGRQSNDIYTSSLVPSHTSIVVTKTGTTPLNTPPIAPPINTSCQPTPTPVMDDVHYICPRPPPPPIKCCPSSTAHSSNCVPCPQPSLISDVPINGDSNAHNKRSVPVLPILLAITMMVTIFILTLALVLFVRYRKKGAELSGRPLFNVRRHYSRNPRKRLDVLLNSTGEKKKGFSRVRTFDSESDEEFTVFQKT